MPLLLHFRWTNPSNPALAALVDRVREREERSREEALRANLDRSSYELGTGVPSAVGGGRDVGMTE